MTVEDGLPHKSSSVKSFNFDFENNNLDVEFQNGSIYQYKNVSVQTYKAFNVCESWGKFVATHLRGKYEFVKIKDKDQVEKAA